MQIFKNGVLGFIIGLLLTGMIVSASTIISGTLISYEDRIGLEVNNIQDAIDKIYALHQRTIKCGDYIEMVPTAGSYTISASDTGYSAAQTIYPNQLTLWRVIDINATGIEVVSGYATNTNVSFGVGPNTFASINSSNQNVIAYQKYVKTLNAIAAQYTNSNYVVATRHMGYNKNFTTEQITNVSLSGWRCDTGKNCAFAESKGGGDLGYLNDYNLVKEALGTISAKALNTNNTTDYWLASRFYHYDGAKYFRGRVIDVNGNLNFGTIFGFNGSVWYGNCSSFAIRPILTLRSDIEILGGTGKANSPYTLK